MYLLCFQEGDVIELCQVSDIRAGGLPKVSEPFINKIPYLANLQIAFKALKLAIIEIGVTTKGICNRINIFNLLGIEILQLRIFNFFTSNE